MEYLKEWKTSSNTKGGEPHEIAQRLLSHETLHGIAVTGIKVSKARVGCFTSIYTQFGHLWNLCHFY